MNNLRDSDSLSTHNLPDLNPLIFRRLKSSGIGCTNTSNRDNCATFFPQWFGFGLKLFEFLFGVFGIRWRHFCFTRFGKPAFDYKSYTNAQPLSVHFVVRKRKRAHGRHLLFQTRVDETLINRLFRLRAGGLEQRRPRESILRTPTLTIQIFAWSHNEDTWLFTWELIKTVLSDIDRLMQCRKTIQQRKHRLSHVCIIGCVVRVGYYFRINLV